MYASYLMPCIFLCFADAKMNHVRSSTVQLRNSGSQSDPVSLGKKCTSTHLLLLKSITSKMAIRPNKHSMLPSPNLKEIKDSSEFVVNL